MAKPDVVPQRAASSPAATQVLGEDELPTIHLILNTDCNAWDLKASEGSPGVCRFCYRERNRVVSDSPTTRRVLDVLAAESSAKRIVFTGGDPVMPYDNQLVPALRRARELGFSINLHTNGLLLRERYPDLRDWVDVYSLAIDGADPATAEWFRGIGYLERFLGNVDMLATDGRALAFNTFTSAVSIGRLGELARLIASIADRTPVEYWLISQYRPIGRADVRKAETYGFGVEEFRVAVDQARRAAPGIAVYDQPTRAPEDPYPFRVWVLADGTVTADLGSVAAPRNEAMGNLLTDGFVPLIRRALARRRDRTETSVA